MERGWIRLPDLVFWSNVQYNALKNAQVKSLSDALSKWASRFNFDVKDVWLLDTALYTLYKWGDLAPDALKFAFLGRADRLFRLPSDVPNLPAKIFEFDDAWDLEFEKLSQFRKRIEKRFKFHLELYIKRLTETAKAQGFVELREQRHFNWLARYQAAGESPKRIASRLKVGGEEPDNTIFKAVQKTARSVDLTLRPGRSGNRTSSRKVK